MGGSFEGQLGVCLRLADEDTGSEDQSPADDNLQAGEGEAGLEVAVADEGDDHQLDPNNCVGPGEGGVNVCDEKGQGVEKAANESHETCDQTAKDRIAAASQLAVVRESFGEGHRDASTHRRSCSDEEDGARVV